ncbi:hypothetical protein OZY43_06060 [Lactobacillus sp. ESL0785]|uniref:hypothetical protein n=1 Tax=Lactobacillus sp. ESL0785 TaxID=2983232 RepID=UPI0023F736A7|nr:hypothetical protein [Lactobacillus sp. ESL0785]WEV70504.1 hypothetical protein OZY43_06060 [Lactobacillus sp. ESL0785]
MNCKHAYLLATVLLAIGANNLITTKTAAAADLNSAPIISYPKNMRGSWYYYDTYTKKVNKEIFTKTTAKFYVGKKEVGYTKLHAYVKHNSLKADSKYQEKTARWVYADSQDTINGVIWLNILSWDQKVGASYNVTDLDNNSVLTSASGNKPLVDHHAYRTPKLAQDLKDIHYQVFNYYN